MEEPAFDPKVLFKLARWRMPFGRYKGTVLVDLPEPYMVWFRQNGYPKGELGKLLEMVYEIKVNGLEYVLDPLRSADSRDGQHPPYRNEEARRKRRR